MLGYYHPYIKDFAGLMTPVFDLLKGIQGTSRMNKTSKITWEQRHEDAVQKAICRLQHSVLTIPLPSDEFVLETDASGLSVAATLSCKRDDGSLVPVEFASKKLGATEQRWPVRDREAFAIIFGLKKFDIYLRGRHSRCTPITKAYDGCWMPKKVVCRVGPAA
ncbi:uncharacterized protein LOC129617623 [Condylostylus longicornis]|uniref:uncharacterized protein LOC129617623 n=1 Tax=Condylostylus longicornis TaxID=2530218 RepID=UPI00244E4D9B|nr:uncharacterized protein LOC129617623 [Condylostylus longicornis]